MSFSRRSIMIGPFAEHISKYTDCTSTNHITLIAYRVFFEVFRAVLMSIVFARETLFIQIVNFFGKIHRAPETIAFLVEFSV